jgi:hypothetical protein
MMRRSDGGTLARQVVTVLLALIPVAGLSDPLGTWNCTSDGVNLPGSLEVSADSYVYIDADSGMQISGGLRIEAESLIPTDGPFAFDFLLTGTVSADEAEIAWANDDGPFMVCLR